MTDSARIAAWRIGLGALIIGAWQAGAAAGVIDPFFFSRPSSIIARIALWMSSGSLWPHLLVTLGESLLGLTLGAAAGVTTGFVLARSPLVARVLEPYITMLNAIP